MKDVLNLLIKVDDIDGYIYVCPYCHRYVLAEKGIHTCWKCGGKVDNDNLKSYSGKVNFDGELPWRD
jgi:rRNA maturation endonuclease Nob1